MENEGCGCNCKPIKGVRCNVENCSYNDRAMYCTADEISIGPHLAECSGDTTCVTFRQKD